MDHSLFFAPADIPRDRIVEGIFDALRGFDLPPPTRVALCSEAHARATGVWVFTLGAAQNPESRAIHRGFFMDSLRYRFPVGFMSSSPGLSPKMPEEVFELRGYDAASQLLVTSRGALLAGTLAALTVNLPQRGLTNAEMVAGVGHAAAAHAKGWTAIAIGLAQTGLRVGFDSLAGAEVLELTREALVPAASSAFVGIMFSGLEPDDPYPRETDAERIGAAASVVPAPARKLTLNDAMELENEAGTLLRGGDLTRAKALLEEVLESFPQASRAQSLYTSVLERTGDPALERALLARFESGLASPGLGEAMIINVVRPTTAWAEHLLRAGRLDEARAAVERAAAVLTPHFAPHLAPLRARLGGR